MNEMKTITFEIPDKVYEKNQKEIETIVSEADEALGRIHKSITCIQQEPEGEYDWAEQWLEEFGDENDNVDSLILKDEPLLKKISEKINTAIYYDNGYKYLNGAFVNIVHLVAVEINGRIHVHADVEHGMSDEDGSRVNTEYFDFTMRKRKDGTLEFMSRDN